MNLWRHLCIIISCQFVSFTKTRSKENQIYKLLFNEENTNQCRVIWCLVIMEIHVISRHVVSLCVMHQRKINKKTNTNCNQCKSTTIFNRLISLHVNGKKQCLNTHGRNWQDSYPHFRRNSSCYSYNCFVVKWKRTYPLSPCNFWPAE